MHDAIDGGCCRHRIFEDPVPLREDEVAEVVAPLEREVSGRLFVGKAPALRCKECSLVYWQASSLIGFERRIGAVLASEGPATARTFQFLRKAIPLKALDLAALLHVSAETISRWENGKTHLDVGAWATLARIFLEHLEGNTETRDRLRSIDDKKTKRVDLGRIQAAFEA